jgi:photosystem II stability/assembly factor-like uncharacterized protein
MRELLVNKFQQFSWSVCSSINKAVLLFFLFSLLSVSNAQWFWQNPLPQGNSLNDSYFVDDMLGWAVGPYGTCILTTDGGESWTNCNMPVDNNLLTVYFKDIYSGFIGDIEGNLIKTTDGGEHWFITQTFSAYINKVSFLDSNLGWLISGWSLYRTMDGGESWQILFSITSGNMYDFYFIDPSLGFIVGPSGFIVRTTNGGISWNSINSPDQDDLMKVYFKNALQGFILVNDGYLLTTSDGGLNWGYIHIGSYLRDISFNGQDQGILVGVSGTYITSDGGNSWFMRLSSNFAHSCEYLNSSDCIVLGSWGQIYKSTDEGANWQSKSPGTRNHINDITFIDDSLGYAVGDAGTILKTTDKGKNWLELSPLTNEDLRAICFSDGINGWIVGTGSVILNTTNRGQSWQSGTIPNSNYLNDVCFIDSSNGWVTGMNNKIFKTTDAGDSWILQQTSNVYDLGITSIFMVDGNNGYLCGTWGYPGVSEVYKTTNGGFTWQLVKNLLFPAYSIFFTDSSNGWLAGDFGTFRTTDAGINWNEVISHPGRGIHFYNNYGVIGGGNLYTTTNAGATWNEQSVTWELRAVFTGNNGSWAAGIFGSILFNEDLGLPVELVSFSGSEKADTVTLSWSTGTEFNNKGFEIERKSNNIWHTIGFVSGHGTTSEIQNYTYADNISDLQWSSRVYYRLKQVDYDGSFEYSQEIEVMVVLVKEYSLSQNYPNPFNPNTTISYSLPIRGIVQLIVYDVLGREVRKLVDEEQEAGKYEIEFDAEDLTSGIYVYRLSAGERVMSKKMILLK